MGEGALPGLVTQARGQQCIPTLVVGGRQGEQGSLGQGLLRGPRQSQQLGTDRPPPSLGHWQGCSADAEALAGGDSRVGLSHTIDAEAPISPLYPHTSDPPPCLWSMDVLGQQGGHRAQVTLRERCLGSAESQDHPEGGGG